MTDIAPTVALTPAMRQRMLDRLTITGGTHLSPVVETLASRVALIIMPAGKQRLDAPLRRPWIALICDDLLFAEGPSAFHLKSLRELVKRASAAYVMSGSVVPEAYATAANVAAAGANVVIVETQESEEASWMNFIQRHAAKPVAINLVKKGSSMTRKANQ